MTTPFQPRDDRLSRAVDRLAGETFTLLPRSLPVTGDVNARRGAATDRAGYDFIGIFTDGPVTGYPEARGASDHRVVRRQGSWPIIDCTMSQFAQQPVDNDIVVRSHDGTRYEIRKIVPDGFERALLYLSRMS